VNLTENDWFYMTRDFKSLETPIDNTEVSRDEFLSILSDIKHILIKAKYHTNQVESKCVLLCSIICIVMTVLKIVVNH